MCDVSTVLTAVGTIVALVALIYQWYKDLRNKEWEQAWQIACWSRNEVSLPDEGYIIISNTSKQPIYDVIVSIDRVDLKDVGQGDDQCTCVYCVPPGVYLLKTIREEEDYYDMCKHFGPSITFRDARGKYWTRNAQGKLKKQCRDCFVTRDISFPPAFTSIEILQMK